MKRFFNYMKCKILNIIYFKCSECGKELKDYGNNIIAREPIYVCDNQKCGKSIIK